MSTVPESDETKPVESAVQPEPTPTAAAAAKNDRINRWTAIISGSAVLLFLLGILTGVGITTVSSGLEGYDKVDDRQTNQQQNREGDVKPAPDEEITRGPATSTTPIPLDSGDVVPYVEPVQP